MKYFSYLVAYMAGLFGIQYFVLEYALPEYRFPLLILIPLFFILMGYLSMRLVYSKPNASVAKLMAVKTSKILVSIIFVGVYVALIKEQAVSFLFSFLYYYMTYLVFETWMLYVLNKKKSTQKK